MNEIAPLLYISMDSVVGRGLAPAVLRLYLIFRRDQGPALHIAKMHHSLR